MSCMLCHHLYWPVSFSIGFLSVFPLLSCFIIEGRIQTHPGNKLLVLHGLLISPFPYCFKSELIVCWWIRALTVGISYWYIVSGFLNAVRTINNHKYWLPFESSFYEPFSSLSRFSFITNCLKAKLGSVPWDCHCFQNEGFFYYMSRLFLL